jgi:hypothetical protein
MDGGPLAAMTLVHWWLLAGDTLTCIVGGWLVPRLRSGAFS